MGRQASKTIRSFTKRRSVQHRARVRKNQDSDAFEADGKIVYLTNLNKLFWPDLGISKRDLLQYYVDIAPVLLPHLANRAMVMKRYPNGITGDFFS